MTARTEAWPLGLRHSLAAAVFLFAAASAQAAPRDAEYESLRRQMLLDTRNPESAFVFAQAASRRGDFLSAIRALELVLALRPDLANVQHELGLLYRRIGQPEIGDALVRKAMASGQMPAAVRERTEQILAAPAAARTAPPRSALNGTVGMGLRIQSNANTGPGSAQVLIGGQPALLDTANLSAVDQSAEVQAGVTYRQAVGRPQPVALMQSEAQFYGQFHREQRDIDLAGFSTRLGPWFSLGPTTVQWRPQVSASYFRLGADPLFHSLGLGGSARWDAGTASSATLTLGASRQHFNNTPARFLSDRNATLFSLASEGLQALHPGLVLLGQASAEYADAETRHQSYQRFGLGLGAAYNFRGLSAVAPDALSANLRGQTTRYAAPDAQFNPGQKRRDYRLDASTEWRVPLNPALAGAVSLQFTRNHSNIPNFDYVNATLGLRLEQQFGN